MKNPINTDARGLTSEQLTDLRCRAVSAVQSGESPASVARVLGVSKASVYNWLALYRGGGWHKLDARKRGGRKPLLDGGKLKWIYDVVTLGNPEQLKFPFALWSSKLLAVAIKQKFGISLSKASVCRVLHQLGLSPQRPLWRAYQRDPEAVERWLSEEFPAIREAARKAGAEVWFGDEAGIKSDSHSGTTWAPVGRTPVVDTTGARFGLNVISAINSKGALRFMCMKGNFNAGVFIEFLGRLMKSAGRPVYLVVDGHASHKAKKVMDFVAAQNGRIKLFFLPVYAPDLNPDELVWNNLKNHGTGNRVIAGLTI